MRGIERVFAAILLTGAVVGAAAFAFMLGHTPDVATQFGLPGQGAPGMVYVAPLPGLGGLTLQATPAPGAGLRTTGTSILANAKPLTIARLVPLPRLVTPRTRPTHHASPAAPSPVAPEPAAPSAPAPTPAPAAPAPAAPAAPSAPAAPVTPPVETPPLVPTPTPTPPKAPLPLPRQPIPAPPVPVTLLPLPPHRVLPGPAPVPAPTTPLPVDGAPGDGSGDGNG